MALLVAWFAASGWHPSRSRFARQGIDVSHHQGAIDWRAVKQQDVDFAYVKASEGGDYQDPAFGYNWKAAGEAGIARGAYHFFSACRSGSEQARNFLAALPAGGPMLPPAVDLEFGGACAPLDRVSLRRELSTFLRTVEARTRRPTLLYVMRDFDQVYGVSTMFHRPLWLRRLVFQPDYGGRPWSMWQASNFRRLRGIEGRVDWDVRQP